MSAVTLATPFRTIPALPLATWTQEFTSRQSPLTAAQVKECHDACGGWSWLLDRAISESSLRDADAIRDKNLLRMKDNAGFVVFPAFWVPFALKYQQVFDPQYKDAAYYQGGAGSPPGYDLSLAGASVVYIGGPECLRSRGKTCVAPERYDPNRPMTGASVVTDPTAPSINRSIAASMLRYERWFGTPAPQPGPEPVPGEIVFGRVPKPVWQDRQIPDRNNRAWDNLGPRQLRGVVYHRMLGTLWGTDGWFRGGGGGAGLTDFGIDNTSGETLEWNSYRGLGRAGISANRAGWASGPWENPPGDGRAFVATFGANAINRDLVSLEIAGNYDSPLSEAAVRQIVALSAYLADQARVPWTDYPRNPHTGLVFSFWHNEFTAQKVCPGRVVMDATPGIIERTKARLKQHQTGATA